MRSALPTLACAEVPPWGMGASTPLAAFVSACCPYPAAHGSLHDHQRQGMRSWQGSATFVCELWCTGKVRRGHHWPVPCSNACSTPATALLKAHCAPSRPAAACPPGSSDSQCSCAGPHGTASGASCPYAPLRAASREPRQRMSGARVSLQTLLTAIDSYDHLALPCLALRLLARPEPLKLIDVGVCKGITL